MAKKRPATLEDVQNNCLAMRAQKAVRTMTRAYDEAMRPIGVTSAQFTLLMYVKSGAGQSISFMAEMLSMERTTLTRNLRPLEKAGLVAISNEGYRRTRSISLTEAGEQKLKDGLPLWREVQERTVRKLGDNWRETRRMLDKLATIG